MRRGNFTLRTKLVCATAAVVSLAGLPLVYLGYSDAYRNGVASAEAEFSHITRMIGGSAALSYLDTQVLVLDKTAIEKDDIRTELDAIEKWLADDALLSMRSTLDFLQEAWDTHTAVVNDWGEFVYLSPAVKKAWLENTQDYLGVPFRTYIRNTSQNSYRDEFTFMRLTDETGFLHPYILATRKLDGYIAVVMQQLDYLEGPYRASFAEIEKRTAEAIRTIELNEATAVVVRRTDGRAIASRGEGADAIKMPGDLLEKAKSAGFASGMVKTPAGEWLYAVRYLKALDWYVAAATPSSAITGPAAWSAVNLAVWVILALIVASAFAVFAVSWFLAPLKRLAATAGRLSTFDLKAENPKMCLGDLVKGLPEGMNDEVGMLARAFAGMTVALERNINELKASLARQHGYEGESKAAREIQEGLRPASGSTFDSPGFRAAALMNAAREVGGDFFDVFALPEGRKALILGDVSGKGASAALLMCVTLTLARNALETGLGPAAAMKQINDQVAARNPTCMFATLWIGIFDHRDGTLRFSSGGHCPPAVLHAETRDNESPLAWERFTGGPLVGVFEDAAFTESEAKLAPGDLWFVYSDGVSEAMNEKRELFGEAGIARALSSLADRSPAAVIDAMMQAIVEFRGRAAQSDDITMLVFQRPVDSMPAREEKNA